MEDNKQKNGVLSIISAYILWGFLPIYWRLVDHVPAGDILAHRVVWSCILMIGIVLLSQNGSHFIRTFRMILKDKRKLLGITIASTVISFNWLTYIWAVNNGYVIEASLGYYINPLISIILAVVVLKEKITGGQLTSFLIAGIGVIILTYSFGTFPWISFVLAITFAVYGLLKKVVDVQSMFGLTIETMLVAPIALIYLLAIPKASFTIDSIFSSTSLLLIGTGFATAIPLLLFAHGAKRIPLAMLGFLQYISPTIMLIIGIFIFKETFSLTHFISFALIWIALIIYLGSIRIRSKS